MSFDKAKNLSKDGSGYAFAVVASRFNGELVDALLDDVLKVFSDGGVARANTRVVRVPGATEIPAMASLLASTGNYDAVVALGVVIKGQTPHHEIIGNSTAVALQHAAVKSGVPIINGIIVTNDRSQAEARTTGKIRRGVEFGESALDMAHVAEDVFSEYLDSVDNGDFFDEDFGEGVAEFLDGDDDVVLLPEDEIYEKGVQKKRVAKRSRKPRKG